MSPVLCVMVLGALLAFPLQTSELSGTWSGGWTVKGGVRDSATLELKDNAGKIEARLLTPVALTFGKASFDAKTGRLVLEGADPKSGKPSRIEAKVSGTELQGTFVLGDASGELRFIKWTYFGR